MPNDFGHEEIIEDFANGVAAFDDMGVAVNTVSRFSTDSGQLARTGNVIWVPQPDIATVFDGMDATANMGNTMTELQIPITVGFQHHIPFVLDIQEARDRARENNLSRAALQRLASKINSTVNSVAANQGTLVVTSAGPATGYDDAGLCSAKMIEEGVSQMDTQWLVGARDYIKMAGNLAARQTLAGKTQKAYEKAFIDNVAGFSTFKNDTAFRLTARTATGVTMNGANQFYTPKSKSTATTGEISNVDNRYQTVIFNVTAGALKAGDCFSVVDVESVHHITKAATGSLKTFRIISLITAGGPGAVSAVISPPFISGQGGTSAELQQQNISSTPLANAVVNMLNTTTAYVHPFYEKEAICLTPAHYAIPKDSGPNVMQLTSESGIEINFSKSYNHVKGTIELIWRAFYGVTMKAPEQCGIMLFNQL